LSLAQESCRCDCGRYERGDQEGWAGVPGCCREPRHKRHRAEEDDYCPSSMLSDSRKERCCAYEGEHALPYRDPSLVVVDRCQTKARHSEQRVDKSTNNEQRGRLPPHRTTLQLRSARESGLLGRLRCLT